MWRFAESSEDLLRKCIEAASTSSVDENNVFHKHFSHLRFQEPFVKYVYPHENNRNENNIQDKTADLIQGRTIEPSRVVTEEINDLSSCDINVNTLIDDIESEPSNKFQFMVEVCTKTPKLLTTLASKLSTSSAEKIFIQIFTEKDVNKVFLDHFYKHFFLTFIKRENNWLSLDLLKRASKSHPLPFDLLLKLIIKDMEIPCQFLQNYSKSLNTEDKLKLLYTLMEVELTSEVTVYHLFTIYDLFRDSAKSVKTQNFILELLKNTSEVCRTDKNYGKLLMLFLQSLTHDIYVADSKLIERLVDKHQSPFKRLCYTILSKMAHGNIENDTSQNMDN